MNDAGEKIKEINGVGMCENALYGGGNCQIKPCDAGCKQIFGSQSYGLCFFYQKPDDTCVCRHPC
jgi:hypothetical protein